MVDATEKNEKSIYFKKKKPLIINIDIFYREQKYAWTLSNLFQIRYMRNCIKNTLDYWYNKKYIVGTPNLFKCNYNIIITLLKKIILEEKTCFYTKGKYTIKTFIYPSDT